MQAPRQFDVIILKEDPLLKSRPHLVNVQTLESAHVVFDVIFRSWREAFAPTIEPGLRR